MIGTGSEFGAQDTHYVSQENAIDLREGDRGETWWINQKQVRLTAKHRSGTG
jgi:hypothetical protein